ncbi:MULTISPECIES: hypothetical protein [Sporosarcina]|uniref:hypothetical protein n=1 Tax=Sporosarcina TaxID=1569 RepID=UPI00129BC477|nr:MULTISPECIES: hypothetical protein [Sporosarcina]GKV63918.1 hypothetical protein NCCP2331_00710 [Sporosarcina sp. NCCP-2331]GLB54698.1 hypothetical protein NCCP2378_04830 [Sporosarcina sp. NCCP-2378]
MTNTKLAILTSVFILASVIYSSLTHKPLYQLTSYLDHATIMMSIITLGIHYNAVKETPGRKRLILFSLSIPVSVIIYFTIGLVYWINNGVN